MLRAELTNSFPIHGKRKKSIEELFILLKKALLIFANEGQERIFEEEYELYKKQYPFEEYYYFKEEFKYEWE